MKAKRVLIIVYEVFQLHFVLIRDKGKTSELLASKSVRVYDRGYSFSLVNYILDQLTLWGNELEFSIVKERVPIIPHAGKHGIDKIIILASQPHDDLNSLSKKVGVYSKDIEQKGAANVVKLLAFDNLLSVSLDMDRTYITRYEKNSKGGIRVIAENKKFDISQYAVGGSFASEIEKFKKVINVELGENVLMNTGVVPPFHWDSMEESLIDYLTCLSRLKPFLQKKKLELYEFGEKGSFEDNLLVLGGSWVRIAQNIPTFVLAVSTVFNLKGNFSIYLDKYGVFDYIQRSEKSKLKMSYYTASLLEQWGNFVTLHSKKKANLDVVCAEVNVSDDNGERQVIPMYGKVHSVAFEGEGSVDMKTEGGFHFGKNKYELNLKDLLGNFVFDCRQRPIYENFNMVDEAEITRSWLKGVGAF